MNKPQKPILLYDSECTMCNRFKMTLEKLDTHHRINYVTLHNEETYQQYPQLNKAECHQTIHLIDEFGLIHKGPQVIEYLLKLFPTVAKFAWLLDNEMGKKAIDFFYQKVNDIRNSDLNKCNKCKTEPEEN